MGMDLYAVDKYSDDEGADNRSTLRYNWSGWRYLSDLLMKSEEGCPETFKYSNDGEVIPSDDCISISKAIVEAVPTLDAEHADWLRPHVQGWISLALSGGAKQL